MQTSTQYKVTSLLSSTMESGETNTLQKHNNEKPERTSETPLPPSSKKTNKGTKFDEVWQYFIQGEEINKGHYRVSCYYCQKNWSREQPGVLKAHLANEYTSCPKEISNYWRDKLSENKINYTQNLQKPLSTQSLQKQHNIWFRYTTSFSSK
ncbi:16761_t:CDS:2 [Funneliformis mosseae]|uniref:16761_t:CDS:1 n=1 Tax=Funneliformis mosseae TaxID=27381 RepID=A0A9N8V071_FUNMO|nr:16761_t:CDS:2 [Funneliformis mosseae]